MGKQMIACQIVQDFIYTAHLATKLPYACADYFARCEFHGHFLSIARLRESLARIKTPNAFHHPSKSSCRSDPSQRYASILNPNSSTPLNVAWRTRGSSQSSTRKTNNGAMASMKCGNALLWLS